MKTELSVIITISMFFLILSACAPQSSPSPTPPPQLSPASTAPEKPGWQRDWEVLLAAARQEGRVVVLTGVPAEVRSSLAKSFKEATGIEAEFIAGRAPELAEKLSRERRAGLYLADILISGFSLTAISKFKPEGFHEPVDPFLLLPEVKEPRFWKGEKLYYVDKDRHYLAFIMRVYNTCIIINTELVKPEEIKGYRDLLNPKWRGKITLFDPTVSGMGLTWFGAVTHKILDLDYMRQIAALEPVIQRDMRLHMEWVARGKYPVGLAAEPAAFESFRQIGAPIKGIIPVEGNYAGSGFGNVSAFNKAPHPNAAKLFLNWLLTKEGQTVYSLASGEPSIRVDVSTGHLDPEIVPESGKTYILKESEDLIQALPEDIDKAKEIFGPLLK